MGSGNTKSKTTIRKSADEDVTPSVENGGIATTNTTDIKVTATTNFAQQPRHSARHESHDQTSDQTRTGSINKPNDGLLPTKSNVIDVPKNEGRNLSDEECFKKYCDESPQLVELFTSVYEAVKVLKTKFDQGVFLNQCTNALLKADVIVKTYFRNKDAVIKQKAGCFLVDIGFPQAVVDICCVLKTLYPEYLTWEREKAEEDLIAKELEATENAETDVGKGNVKENEVRKDEKDTDTSHETNTDPNVLTKVQDLISSLALSCINFSDLNDDFCQSCGQAGIIQVFVDIADNVRACTGAMVKYMNPETQTLKKYSVRGKLLSRIMGTLHNLSRRVPCRGYFQTCNAVQILLPFLKDEVTLYAAKALLILAYLIDEDNNNLIMADAEPIKFLIYITGRACQMVNRRCLGFSNSELAEGLTQIAINDANKKLIGANGAIPILVKMISNAKDDKERKSGAEALWVLAFDAQNREIIINHADAIDTLKKLRESNDEQVKRMAGGALWEIEGKQNHVSSSQVALASDEGITNHIMISYQWDVQSILLQVKNKLQAAGFKVWMDLEQMGGSTLEAMARAVENSAVVLVCVSQKYKESSNCRSEAEYAFQLRKDIIPLMMEKNYRPDGWLGMIMGSKLWINFSARHNVDGSVEKLQKEIGVRGKGGEPIVKVAVEDVVDALPKIDISTWTKDDVMKWMKETGLMLSKNSEAKEFLNGRMLIRLSDLRNESPEFFYSSVKNDLGFKHVFQVLHFTDELDKLVS